MAWYDFPIDVPYGNANFDVALGGSHDLDVKTPLGTTITAPASGTISSIDTSSPWGQEVGVKFDNPYKGVPYYAILHMGSVRRGLAVGQHVDAGTAIGLSGGANSAAQNQGSGLFIDSPEQSSGPQTGLALMRGPTYGKGAGWNPIDPSLDPTGIISTLRGGKAVPGDTLSGPGATPSPGSSSLPDWAQGIISWLQIQGEKVAVFIVSIILIILGVVILLKPAT